MQHTGDTDRGQAVYDPNTMYRPRATGIKASIESIHRVICKHGGVVTMSVYL